jgi:aminoglycoside phosphotransferase (APT) family kinase protein
MSPAATNPVALVDTTGLTRYLESVVDLGDRLRIQLLSGGRSNLTFLATSGSAEYVVRRRPLGSVAAGAHDMAREYRVQAALQGTGLPLATMYGYCDDESVMGAPFYVMSRVHGHVYHRLADVSALTADQARRMSEATVDVLDQLHRVDPASVGLGDLGRPEGFLARRIGRWLDQWRRSEHREHDLVEPLGARLASSVPEHADSTLVHGDFRLGNLILSPTESAPVAAVLDWEMSTLGDPLTDVAHLLVYWDRTRGRLTHESQSIAEHPGFLTSGQLADRYEQLSGRDLADLPFYLAFEHWRAAIIKEGIHTRTRALHTGESEGHSEETEDDDIGQTVSLHLEEAAEILGSG